MRWLDQTFHSKPVAEELLRPEWESGLITEHDYRLAADFLPGGHKYYPVSQAAKTLCNEARDSSAPYDSTSRARSSQACRQPSGC